MQFFFFFFFLQNITQSIVPDIEKICYTTSGLRANCSGCETHIYKVFTQAECRMLNNIPDFEATLLKWGKWCQWMEMIQ